MGTVRSNTDAARPCWLIAVLAVGALAAAALGGCSSDQPQAAARTTPKPAAVPVSPVNPLTGLAPSPAGSVIAVKVDDTEPGRPSMGLDKSDVIYIEEAEGGESRMVVVFATAMPKVRAVRSVRSSDPELLGPYGRIVLVASGGGGSALPTLDRSTLWSSINDRNGPGFSRDSSRQAPYNLVSNLAKVSAARKGAGVRDVGFTWGAVDPRLATAKAALKVNTRVGSTNVSFVWNAKVARYVRTVGGRRILAADGAPIAQANVLVQYCTISQDRSDVDVLGNPSLYTKTIGTGTVVLFRDGRRIAGTWSRPSYGARTTFKDAAGTELLFAPGGTFVVLVRPGAPA